VERLLLRADHERGLLELAATGDTHRQAARAVTGMRAPTVRAKAGAEGLDEMLEATGGAVLD
jgi:hypothetical protein